MNTSWIRLLYDAGTRLEIRADRRIETLLWGAVLRRFRSRHRKK